MLTTRTFRTISLCATLIITSLLTAQAQTTATWIGASGGEWNTAANWDAGAPPLDSTTNAIIGNGTNVNYNLPMIAASFGGLTNRGTLNINTNGFNCTTIYVSRSGSQAQLFVNTGAVVNVTGNFGFNSNSIVTMSAGSSVNVGGTLLVGSGPTATVSGTGPGSFATMTNNGGTLTAAFTTVATTGQPSTPPLFVINGGINNLGQVSVGRVNKAVALGLDGLVVNGGFVNISNLSIASQAFGTMYMTGGTVTNTGSFLVSLTSGGATARPERFTQAGGLYVDPTGTNIVTLTPVVVSGSVTTYAVTGGTNIVGGFLFGGAGSGSGGICNFTNAALIYIGSGGISSNGTIVLNASLNNGGLFGATAPWVGSSGMSLNGASTGTFTFQTADMFGNPNNIQLTGVLKGTGNLNKTGGGTLLFSAANTYSGSTLINGGTLAVDVNGSIASSKIIVGTGTIFDVSAVAGGFVLTNQILSGSGVVTGAVLVAANATINPGSNTLTGTLSFSNSVTETGGAINHFDLVGAPNPNNDLVLIAGDLDVSGTNTIDIGGAGLQTGSAYKLIQYAGNFNGGLTNFTITSALGILTNDTTAKTISFIPQTTLRAPTNIVWVGNPVNTNWDTENSTNWLNAGALDFFVPGDNVQFTDLGATNSPINIVGTVTPNSILVNSKSNYVFASTSSGLIGGAASLTVTNSGTLTILTTNTYSGVTTISSGVLAVTQLANGLAASAIGAASSDPANLVISNGIFSYSGPTVSIDRGATLNGTNSTIDVSANGNLTISGTLAGNGGLTKIDNGTLIISGANSYAGITTLSNGVLEISSTASALGANTVNFVGGTLSLSGVGGQPTFPNTLNVITTGALISGGNDIQTGAWTGSANAILNVTVNSGSTFSVDGSMTNFLGTIELGGSAGTFRFNSTGGSGGDTAFGGQNTTYDLGTNTVTMQARNSQTINLGALEGGVGTILAGQGTAGGSGLLTYVIGANTNNPSTTFAGTIKNFAANEIAAITKVGTGTLTLLGNNTYSGSTIVNSGVLALSFNPTNSSDGSINNTTNINLAASAVIDVSGRSDDTLPLGSTQILQGNGTIRGIFDTSSGGTLAPGGGLTGSVGTLTVTNNINLGSTAWMKLNRAASPNSDRLISSTAGIINYGGTLIVTNVGARLQVGDTFTLFNAATYNNSFGTIILPNPNYYTWDTSQLAVNGSIKLTAITPPPAITNVDFSQLVNGSITLNAINGAPGGPVTVLTSTNVALPLNTWTTVTTGNFDGSGNFNAPITVNPAAPQQYFILSAQ